MSGFLVFAEGAKLCGVWAGWSTGGERTFPQAPGGAEQGVQEKCPGGESHCKCHFPRPQFSTITALSLISHIQGRTQNPVSLLIFKSRSVAVVLAPGWGWSETGGYVCVCACVLESNKHLHPILTSLISRCLSINPFNSISYVTLTNICDINAAFSLDQCRIVYLVFTIFWHFGCIVLS